MELEIWENTNGVDHPFLGRGPLWWMGGSVIIWDASPALKNVCNELNPKRPADDEPSHERDRFRVDVEWAGVKGPV